MPVNPKFVVAPKFQAVLLGSQEIRTEWVDTQELAVYDARKHLRDPNYVGYRIETGWFKQE